ncbi:MAG: DUF4249 family protein [Muribaculaceae bacterium]|nr:DUF4249 family protein [Muribaculaceae bacterium]
MRRLLYLLIVAVATLCSCEKELNFDYHTIDPLLVIEGNMTLSDASVRLTLTTPMNEPMDSVTLTDARVTITDVIAGEEMELLPDSVGIYRIGRGGAPGREYRLTVVRGGNRYVSSCRMGVQSEITAIEMEWVKMPYDRVALLKVEFRDDTTRRGDAYWLRVYRNGEPYRWVVTDDRAADSGRISVVQMTTRRDTTEEDEDDILRPGDVLTASVASVDSLLRLYLDALTLGGSNGPALFSGAPAVGYFLASPIVTDTFVFYPDSIR